jgi:thiamine biosynthesis lipoprotein
MEFDEFSAMNTLVQSAAEGDPQSLQAGFQSVRQLFQVNEARFSRFREDSELSRLNRAAGTWFQSSPELFEVVQEAFALHHLTGGLFDPSILNALQKAGYDRSMDEIKKLPSLPNAAVDDEDSWVRPRFGKTRLDAKRSRILLPKGVQIDLGGIAKGWTASKAADLLSQYSPACTVNAGGDMVCVGLPQGQQAWQISLEDPRDENQVLAVLNIPPGALATTSITRRRWLQGKRPRHHVIDPRTGQPAKSKWLCISVYAPKATQAEAFAKTLLMMGEGEIQTFMKLFNQIRFLAVDRNGKMWGTPQSMEIIDVPQPAQ